ncbi:uncharacterized protein LOC129771576 [Toxorhynchites rutilus septentrionalis]|uniref:uncharacterized protein LOC129771576 n=1 Tax=Toxorhynchites rutilus septentrionalis TaxID=329112 RepID=UPI00247A2ED1|nr:uncharacterized protein LOC129771576 [Toxorhynchites rutilus septentrionalis]XP_055631324.1 uncharacterized protein LOC129771576 [Toxorhynchites rutilus septentrionalis]
MSKGSVISLSTKEGYRAIIKCLDDGYEAIIIDETIPRCRHTFKVPVLLESSFIGGSNLTKETDWQGRRVQLIKLEGRSILYVGASGLRGGGASHSCSSCPTYYCSACNYSCPNGKCYDYCTHRSSHNCAARQAVQRREREEREQRHRREQEERERQERIRREREEREERERLQREQAEQERRRQERLRLQREQEERERCERERLERLRVQREREEREGQERIRRENEERERREHEERERRERIWREQEEQQHQEQLMIERERLERIRREEEEYEREERETLWRIRKEKDEQERQEQLRIERGRREQIRRENEERERREREEREICERIRKEEEEIERQNQLRIERRENAERKRRERKERNRIKREPEAHRREKEKKAVKTKLHDAIETISARQDNELEYISDDEVMDEAHILEYAQTIEQEGPPNEVRLECSLKSASQKSEIDLKGEELFATQAFRRKFSTARHIDDIPDDLCSPDFSCKQITIAESNSGKLIATVLKYLRKNFTEDLVGVKSETKLAKAIKRNMSKVPIALQQSILEYVFYGGRLHLRIVRRYPVFRWIEQSLITEIVSYPDDTVDPLLLDVFRNHWLRVKDVFYWERRRELLYSVKIKQLAHKLTLADVNDILDLVLRIGDDGLAILRRKNLWYRKLKRRWFHTKVRAVDFDEEGKALLIDTIVNIPWNAAITERIFTLITRANNPAGALKIITTIKDNHVPSSIVLDILTGIVQASEDRIEVWSGEIDHFTLMRHLYELSPSIASVVDAKLQGCLRKTQLLGKLLKNFVSKYKDRVELNLATFIMVLEHTYTYQVSIDIWNEVFCILRGEKNPNKWIAKVDQLIISRIFAGSHELCAEELIEKIIADAKDLDYIKNTNLNKVLSAVDAAYNAPAQFLSNNEFSEYRAKSIRKYGYHEIRLWACMAMSAAPDTVSESEMVAVIKRAVEYCHKYSPRETQLLSLLILMNPTENKGRLSQINTGEGKSIIVAMLAVVLALRGNQVDVVTTSTELSIPEVEKQRAFFELFHLTVAENSPDREKTLVYGCNVVYGTTNDFCGDILRSEFLGNDGRGTRKHQAVIVDEVDSMLYDSRTHSVRLADECPGMNHLEVPLAVIWEFIHNIRKHMISRSGKVYFIAEDFEVQGQEIKLYSDGDWETVATEVEDTKNFISTHCEKHLQKLLRQLTASEKAELEMYHDTSLQIMAKEVEMSQKQKEQNELKAECEELRKRLHGLPWNKRDPIIEIPEHLRAYALSQIPNWTKNAILAAWGYTKDAHYTVVNGRIVPINFNETGVLQSNMIWSDGLTQFLQLKEGLRMDPEGISTNFISNVSFFQRYGSNIYGLTGTLGEQSTRDFLDTMYGADMIVIPPYKQTVIDNNQHSVYRCKELAPLVFRDQKSWYESVVENALYHARNDRGVLVICKFISQARDLFAVLEKHHDRRKIFLYTGESTTEFSKNSITSGEIILATNIAGRGTDLKTTAQVEKHGGMCVLVTFLPESYRVEMQNVGRTAREGKRGMAQLIIRDSDNTPMEVMKALRQAHEIQANAKAIEDARGMLIQDALFQRFCQLENRFLPSFEEARKVQQWNFLKTSWGYYSADQLDPKKVAEKSSEWAEKSRVDFVNKALATLTAEQRTTMTEADHKELREQSDKQVLKLKPDFERRYRQNVVEQFCSKQSINFPSELLDCFKKGKSYEPKYGETAAQFKWTPHERKGAEESWGLWLKSEDLRKNDVTLEGALDSFEQSFERDFEMRANSDDLIRNPFYYVLKGNDYLVAKNIPEALACFNRAIELDPIFSVNARYNKAQALLSNATNKGHKQAEALRELRKAKDLITIVYRPSLLTFNTLIAQHACSMYTSQHVQHQLDILSQQEDFIDGAVEVIEQASKNENNVKITVKSFTEILSEAKEDHERAIREASSNGLRCLFTVEEKLPRPWKSIIAVALIGIAQIGAGCLIVACTGGTLGSGLITEGVSDMISSIRSAITGTFSWAAWAAQKVISLAVSIICAGFSGIKTGMKAVKNTATDLVGRTAVGTAQNGIQLAAKEVGLAIGKGIVRECLTEASKYCTDHLFMRKLEDEIRQRVGDTLTKAFLANPLVVRALEEDEQSNSNYWKQKFIKEGLKLLQDKQINECMKIIKEITKGVASQKIPFAGDVMAVAGVLKMLEKLMFYTNKFIAKFNAIVSGHEKKITASQKDSIEQSEIETSSISTSRHRTTAQQDIISDAPNIDIEDADIDLHKVTDDTTYNTKVSSEAKPLLRSHYVEASTAESLANVFKLQITGNLSATIRDNLVNPVLNKVSAHVTSGLFASAEASVATLRKEIKTERDLRSEANDFANAKPSARKTKETSSKKTELGHHSKRAIEEISQEGHLHDTSSLALAASELGAPVHVYDEQGNLKYVVGDKLPGKPITIKHFPPSDEHPLGHFAPNNSKVQVKPTGKNTCALDSVIAQLSLEQKDSLKLHNANDLRERIIENIRNNPKQAERTFEQQAALRSIASNRILQGGAIKQVEKGNREKKREQKSIRKLKFNDPQIQEEVRGVLGDDIEPDSSTMNEADRKDYQIHHLVHQKFKNHEVVKKADVDIVNHPLNKIELPRTVAEKELYGTNRSKHAGRHSNYVSKAIQDKLDQVAYQGDREGWSRSQYKEAVYKIIYNERKHVRVGKDLYENPDRKTRQRGKNEEPREE